MGVGSTKTAQHKEKQRKRDAEATVLRLLGKATAKTDEEVCGCARP